MTVEQGAAEAEVMIRTARRDWMMLFVAGVLWFAVSVYDVVNGISWFAGHLALGCVFVGEAMWIRTFGIDLTAESANLRGLRRRSIPWSQVQAVVRVGHLGGERVSLILEGGERVTPRAPTTLFGFGSVAFERDFQRIGYWWLAHRGESWRPLLPEAPRLPDQD